MTERGYLVFISLIIGLKRKPECGNFGETARQEKYWESRNLFLRNDTMDYK